MCEFCPDPQPTPLEIAQDRLDRRDRQIEAQRREILDLKIKVDEQADRIVSLKDALRSLVSTMSDDDLGKFVAEWLSR
jgi:hypothetical protein